MLWIVVVVLFLAGGGYLLYTQTDVLSKIQLPSIEDNEWVKESADVFQYSADPETYNEYELENIEIWVGGDNGL